MNGQPAGGVTERGAARLAALAGSFYASAPGLENDATSPEQGVALKPAVEEALSRPSHAGRPEMLETNLLENSEPFAAPAHSAVLTRTYSIQDVQGQKHLVLRNPEGQAQLYARHLPAYRSTEKVMLKVHLLSHISTQTQLVSLEVMDQEGHMLYLTCEETNGLPQLKLVKRETTSEQPWRESERFHFQMSRLRWTAPKLIRAQFEARAFPSFCLAIPKEESRPLSLHQNGEDFATQFHLLART
ncbi:uncharacterized protein LOC128333794 isoform X2 [Hemicordylus capensis]|uniref:uncharacterized protein LOC128333794 isoform X2 n=1 Tax=Hemicordylus capensis TaxID=884348 RepID=UPI002302A598|nr:uncharacterized protein LOC128333794 isoform X2 [Hemicordylus capensis]